VHVPILGAFNRNCNHQYEPYQLLPGRQEKEFIQRAGRQVPQVADWAKESNLPMLPRIVSGLAENTNSIFCDGPRARYSEWMSGSATAGTIAERHICEPVVP
jgi:hypothetical protein